MDELYGVGAFQLGETEGQLCVDMVLDRGCGGGGDALAA